MTQNTLKPETLGAWVVHHGRKLQSDQRGPAEFSAIDGAAKGSLLLAGMASSDRADLSAKEVAALAQAASLNPKTELAGYLAMLKSRQLIDVTAGGFIVGAVIVPDYCRFVRNRTHGLLAALVHLGVAYPLILLMLAVVAIESGQKDFIRILATTGYGVVGLLVIVFATWTTNVGNLYSTALVSKTARADEQFALSPRGLPNWHSLRLEGDRRRPICAYCPLIASRIFASVAA